MVVYECAGFQIIKRSPKLTGFDYWLGEKDDTYPFQEKARLEISGILKGDNTLVNRRMKEKIKQTDKSDKTNKPAFITIVEFSRPICKIFKK